ncbi:MAG: GxxExxY protein [Candidatus Berkelbacteria bacterium]
MDDLLYKELSYTLCGLAFDIDNKLGSGHSEKNYADALEILLKKNNISYAREVYSPMKIEGVVIKKKFFDFLIDNKIVLELKVSTTKYRDACRQLYQYLKSSNLKLGLIIRFTKDGVKIKRIPNIY